MDPERLLAGAESAAPGVDWRALLSQFGVAALQILLQYVRKTPPSPPRAGADEGHKDCLERSLCIAACALECAREHASYCGG